MVVSVLLAARPAAAETRILPGVRCEEVAFKALYRNKIRLIVTFTIKGVEPRLDKGARPAELALLRVNKGGTLFSIARLKDFANGRARVQFDAPIEETEGWNRRVQIEAKVSGLEDRVRSEVFSCAGVP